MNYSEWFYQHLQTSADGFVWAVEQVPAARHYSQPPKSLGDWHVARHVFHMLDYERQIVVPVMQQWLGAPPAVVGWEEEASWRQPPRRQPPGRPTVTGPSIISSTNSGPCAASRLPCSPRLGSTSGTSSK